MNRILGWGRAHLFGLDYGKIFSSVSIRRVIGIVIVAAGWTYFLADWLSSAAPNAASSSDLVQKMIWNPSPK